MGQTVTIRLSDDDIKSFQREAGKIGTTVTGLIKERVCGASYHSETTGKLDGLLRKMDLLLSRFETLIGDEDSDPEPVPAPGLAPAGQQEIINPLEV